MAEKGDLLIGRIALREGLITRPQLYDCLIAQERNPARRLGSIMVARGYLTTADVDRLLAIQKAAFEGEGAGPAAGRSKPLGRILIEKGLAAGFQVHDGLRLQGRFSDMGMSPVPRLGEILVKRGYLTKEAVETALQIQSLSLYGCPECGGNIALDPEKESGDEAICAACGARVPMLFAKMASSLHQAVDAATSEHDHDLPDEVRLARFEPANHFGRYVLIREIGRGGAGIVYRAWQRDAARIVALKLLPHDSDTAAGIRTPYGDAEDLKRFYNETRAVAELSHPNIVPILDFGSVENHFFFTMQLIPGATLEQLVRDGVDERVFDTTLIGEPDTAIRRREAGRTPGKPMPAKLAASFIRDIARAVHYAHERGVVHRDLKPSNVIVDPEGRPWVTDFGLAKVKRIGDSAYVKGVIMGTPYYMPPEQAVGDMERVDNLSDVYSLGAMLYELVSGRCPYHGLAPDAVIDALPTKDPEPLRKVAPDAPPGLVAIADKALSRDRAKRYASAGLLAEDLQRFMDDGEPLALAEKPRRGFWKRVKRILNPES